jgi:hypothetical protein
MLLYAKNGQLGVAASRRLAVTVPMSRVGRPARVQWILWVASWWLGIKGKRRIVTAFEITIQVLNCGALLGLLAAVGLRLTYREVKAAISAWTVALRSEIILTSL